MGLKTFNGLIVITLVLAGCGRAKMAPIRPQPQTTTVDARGTGEEPPPNPLPPRGTNTDDPNPYDDGRNQHPADGDK